MNQKLRFFLLSLLYLVFLVLNSYAQTSNCIQGDFIKDIGKSQELIEAEVKLCDELKENSDLQEIYGFVITPKFAQIVRVYKNKAVFTYYEDDVRYKERKLTNKEIETLHSTVGEAKPETQVPLRDYGRCIDMCVQFEFLSINRQGGRRVHIFSPRYHPPNPMNNLANFFNELEKSGDFKHFYYIQNKEKNFELLFADNVWSALAIWKKGDDFRLLVREDSQEEGSFARAQKYFENSLPASGSESYEERLKRLKRRDEIENAAYVWRKFEKGKLGQIVAAPDEIPYFDTAWRFTVNGYQYLNLCVNNNDCALVKVDKSQKPILLKKGDYEASDIIVSPDGRWLVTAKNDQKTSWEKLARINLQTKEESSVNLELSSDFDVIAYIPAHNKFLIRQRKWVGYQKKDLFLTFLLDAETGNFKEVNGNFQPLLYQSQDRKPLQPAQNPNTFWIAKHNFKGTTQFGLYDTKSFTVQYLATWFDIEFDSNDMWVDETEMKIYFVYRGHLLALPLPKTSLSN